MFPWSYGFKLDAGHIIFLGVFYAVVLTVVITLMLAAWRSWLRFRSNSAAQIIWHGNFEDLSRDDRGCRHAFTNEMPGRVCERAFECGHCAQHQNLLENAAPQLMPDFVDDSLGVPVPLDRYYHRGHTWAKPQPDGTYLIGLDELARRVVANPDQVELPAVGARLAAQMPAWKMSSHGTTVLVKAPFDGVVVEQANGADGWYLRVQPAPGTTFDHLLRGEEVGHWMGREMQRIQLMVSESAGIPALADGGVPVDDFAAACPQADWRNISGAMFLEN